MIGKLLNADYIVVGNLVKAGSRFEINVRMLEIRDQGAERLCDARVRVS